MIYIYIYISIIHAAYMEDTQCRYNVCEFLDAINFHTNHILVFTTHSVHCDSGENCSWHV